MSEPVIEYETDKWEGEGEAAGAEGGWQWGWQWQWGWGSDGKLVFDIALLLASCLAWRLVSTVAREDKSDKQYKKYKRIKKDKRDGKDGKSSDNEQIIWDWLVRHWLPLIFIISTASRRTEFPTLSEIIQFITTGIVINKVLYTMCNVGLAKFFINMSHYVNRRTKGVITKFIGKNLPHFYAYILASAVLIFFKSNLNLHEYGNGIQDWLFPWDYVWPSPETTAFIKEYDSIILGMIYFTKDYFQRLINHVYCEHADEVIMSWNIFEHNDNGTVTFTIPTEEITNLSSVVKDDMLLEKVRDALHEKPNIPYPDFMVILPRDEDTSDFARHVTNHVSSRMAVSQWPRHALTLRKDFSNFCEKVLILVTYEKEDEGKPVPNVCTRIWLVFESELQWLMNYTEDQIKDKSIFKVERENWRTRILNLREWAVIEQDKGLQLHQSRAISLPYSYYEDSFHELDKDELQTQLENSPPPMLRLLSKTNSTNSPNSAVSASGIAVSPNSTPSTRNSGRRMSRRIQQQNIDK